MLAARGRLELTLDVRDWIATAMIQEATLITADDKILEYPHVETFW